MSESPSQSESGRGDLRAIIDIGTNSVKLLVAEVSGRVVMPLHEVSEQTRLGRGFYETQQLQSEAIADTVRVLNEFKYAAAHRGARRLQVIATSAVRDARNQQQFIDMVWRDVGVKVDVITGDLEADWVYSGVTSDPALTGKRLLIVDVGGGSTEFILGEGEQKQFQKSFPLGSVRSLERLAHSDPPTSTELARCRQEIGDFIRAEIVPALLPVIGRTTSSCCLVGTGGASTIMGRILMQLEKFERERLDGAVLNLREVHPLVERLWGMDLEARRGIVGLPKKRADVILTGGVIYEQLMEALGFEEVRISTRGLRFGGLLQPRV